MNKADKRTPRKEITRGARLLIPFLILELIRTAITLSKVPRNLHSHSMGYAKRFVYCEARVDWNTWKIYFVIIKNVLLEVGINTLNDKHFITIALSLNLIWESIFLQSLDFCFVFSLFCTNHWPLSGRYHYLLSGSDSGYIVIIDQVCAHWDVLSNWKL